MRRRTIVFGGPPALLLAARGLRARTAAAQSPPPPPAERAARAYAAFVRSYTVPDGSRLGERLLLGQGNPYSYLWPLSNGFLAALALLGMPEDGGRSLAEVQRYLRGLAIYWDPRSMPPGYASYPPPLNGDGGDLYYDDNAWVAVPLLQYHRLTGDPAGLAAARRVFDFLLSGWDDDPTHGAPGGIFWVKAGWSRNRNTVSTAPAALAGLHLHELTDEDPALDWAVRMFGWLNRYLLSPEGLYWDHVRLDGAVDQGVFAYNQGAAVGVSLMLERITGDRAYLGWARRTADAMLAIYAEQGLEAQAPGFTALFARYLLALWARTEDERYRAFVEQYAAFTWQTRRDPTSDLFRFDLQGTASEVEQGIIAQSAMTQINALLAWPASQFRLLV